MAVMRMTSLTAWAQPDCAFGTIAYPPARRGPLLTERHEENPMKKIIAIIALSVAITGIGQAGSKKELDTPAFDKAIAQQMIDSSIQRFELAEGIGVEDAIESMQLRANMLNFKLVADLPLSEQVKSMGQDANYMRILAFCDALIAKKMVEYNIIFAGFLPCRIAVLEDSNGKGWIVTMNMDMMLHAVDLPADLQPLAKKVRDTIYSIVDAGVNGDL
jgi:uncharacterized protein (DUF302 family)